MRPAIILRKGEKPQIPVMNHDLSPTRRAMPKKADDFMDRVVDVKDLSGKVIFTGTPRQWQKWASAREVQARLDVGLPARAKEPLPKSRYRK